MLRSTILFAFLTGILLVLTYALLLQGNRFWMVCDIGLFIGSCYVSKGLMQFKRAIPEDLKKE